MNGAHVFLFVQAATSAATIALLWKILEVLRDLTALSPINVS